MYPVFYYHEFNKCDLESDGRSLGKKFNELILDLKKNRNTNLGDVKLINGSGGVKFFRAKLSDKDRLLFTSIKYDNRGAFVILEVILDHRYDKSKFLTQKEKIEILSENNNEVPDSTECKIEVPQIFWLGKFITFSTKQEEKAKSADDLPLVVSGSAANGKTSVALEKLRKIEEKFQEGKILYIIQTESLIKNQKNCMHMNIMIKLKIN